MEDLSHYYTLLRDPTRRKIVEILGSQEKIGFKELRQSLGLGVGTVYYHLDMLSSFLTQDRQRKYMLNNRGKTLYRVLKEGNVPATVAITESFSHVVGKWLFLSPVFAKTIKPLQVLPLSIAVLVLGALGSAYARLDSALFFYLQYSTYSFSTIAALYVFNWIGLYLFAEVFTYFLYKRVGNDLQLFTGLCLATFPIAVFPYLCMILSTAVLQYLMIILQIWTLLLISAAFCFGKGVRLDKAIVMSLTAMYLNIAVLFLLGRFT